GDSTAVGRNLVHRIEWLSRVELPELFSVGGRDGVQLSIGGAFKHNAGNDGRCGAERGTPSTRWRRRRREDPNLFAGGRTQSHEAGAAGSVVDALIIGRTAPDNRAAPSSIRANRHTADIDSIQHG